MKYSVAAIAAMATVAVAKPSLTESSYPDLKEGATVKLGFEDCKSKCTIILQDGESGNLKDVKTLTTDASGDSVEVTLPSKLPTAKYAFLIKDNGETDPTQWNYSQQFEIEGTGSASSSAAESSATKTDDESSTTEASSTETESKTESETKTDSETTSATETASTTETASKTSESHASTTSQETAAPSTDAPNSNNAGSLSSRLSPLALIAGGAAAMLFLS